jgi:hypothetical protein
MSEFVQQCRQEWARLGVPAAVAEEMALELGADLRDAEAAGMSVEEYLGPSAADPQAFAASWAAERGIVPTPADRERRRRRPFVLVAFTAAAALTLVVAAILLITGEPRISLATSRTHGGISPLPGGPIPHVRRHVSGANASAPIEWILLLAAAVALGFAAWLWVTWNRSGSIVHRAAH